jgi:hypothetical protein
LLANSKNYACGEVFFGYFWQYWHIHHALGFIAKAFPFILVA